MERLVIKTPKGKSKKKKLKDLTEEERKKFTKIFEEFCESVLKVFEIVEKEKK